MSDEKNKLLENSKAERAFLHDLATPLMIASGHVEHLATHGFDSDPVRSKERLEKAHASLQKITELLNARRKELHKIPRGSL